MISLEEVGITATIFIILIIIILLFTKYYSTETPHRVSVFDWFWNRKSFSPEVPYSNTLRRYPSEFDRSVSITTNNPYNDYNRYIPHVDRETIPIRRESSQANYENYVNYENYEMENGLQTRKFDDDFADIDSDDQMEETSGYNHSRRPVEDWVSINEGIDYPQSRMEKSEISGFYYSNGQKQNKFDTILDENFIANKQKFQNTNYFQNTYQQNYPQPFVGFGQFAH